MNPLGTVFADNIDDKESLASIRFGLIKGTGLLGEVVAAVNKLVELELEAQHAWNEYMGLEAKEVLREQRVKFYETLKAIERAGA